MTPSRLGRVDQAILVAMSTGPVALVALGRMLPNCHDFARELGGLIVKGWVRRSGGVFCEYELTETGRRVLDALV